MCAATPAPNFTFGSDNTAGICPEAWAGLTEANAGCVASYGDDPFTTKAKARIRELFQTDCEVFFVFNGTAANSLALAACCRSPFTRVICHDYSHIDTDECGAPELFTGGAKLTALSGPNGKLQPAAVEGALHLGHGVHFPKPAALSLTQSTEWGTLYTADELRALTSLAHANGLAVHMDGARFANAVEASHLSPADLTWRAGVDVLSFGGTKNGMQTAEAVVFFNHDLARDFEYRVKQGGQLASKMRYAGGQWLAMLRDGAWLRHAAHANAMARRLADAIRQIPSLQFIVEPQVNALFVEMPPAVYAALTARGWQFYRFIGENGYRLMCSWATTEAEVDAFVADLRATAR
ncbi:threonine aldolase family protein [Opitutus terrae]|uniref:L-threonine aldolase n=1 Tax=Opitutus terrae (strain DSM 11246 / JCM 15787 / PB90-1) TaxID=452637 RepID=B1ZZW2_OPITP|nr:low specificity L-threonine aldolase [Opitutus terrae]ACB77295.1 Threonine aldolase [Opitutus terrae PB90-1]